MTHHTFKRYTHSLLTLATIVGLSVCAQAATEQSNSKAEQILGRSLKTYRSLQSYQGTIVKSSESPAGKVTSRQIISWKAPRYLNLVTINGTKRFLDNYDGTKYNFTDIDNDGFYWSNRSLPDTSYGRKVLLQYQPAGSLFTPFLAGVNPFEHPFGMPVSSIKLGSPSTLGGVKVDTIIATPKMDSKTYFTYLIGQKDHLIRRISMESVTAEGDKFQTIETHSNIKTNVTFAPGTFNFIPPANAPLKLPSADAAGATLKPGDTPPAINAKDIKDLPATLDKYKGKVLLLDFWASWCGPCIVEMPYLKGLYEQYHSQGFDILGVSQDATLTDLKKYLKAESIPWQQVFDPEGMAAAPYSVMYIPYSVLIGRDGKVIAVNQKKLLLDAAIRKALKE